MFLGAQPPVWEQALFRTNCRFGSSSFADGRHVRMQARIWEEPWMRFRFEWNSEKARGNLRKRGVAFEEAATVFADPREMMSHDESHSRPEEDRFVSLGLSARERLLVVVYCERGDRVRIISARLATRQETGRYRQE